jgi:hypothetical protein
MEWGEMGIVYKKKNGDRRDRYNSEFIRRRERL